jgi:predicted SAM-dependent methyltransferase
MNIHLGCGIRRIPGFVNVDRSDLPHLQYKAPLAPLPMFPDDAADLIYCSHAFEYLDRQEAIDALREWRRVLRPGGTLRLAVPDFEALVAVYLETKHLSASLGPLYGRMEVRTPEPRLIYHRTVYDYESLRVMLEEAGLRRVRRYDWRTTVHKDHDDCSQAYIPHMDKDRGRLISLNVEAEKL